jgi:3-methyladenine DNA glycosylase AlkC
VAAFKDEIGPALVRRLADELAQAWPAFPRRRFLAGLDGELAARELMARVELVAARLGAALPSPFPAAADVMWAALASPSFTGWMTLPVGMFVARHGLDEPEVALPLLAGLTPRWSSEMAVRPFIEHHPGPAYEHLHRWAADEDEHVRRLVSDGTRPRLPWAPLLRGLIADPSPNVALLDALVDDPSAYVRRSVANHLNDISKDHPDLALDLARRWAGRSDGAAVRHGLRTLVKRGHPEALAVVGADHDAAVRLVDLTVEPARVAVGESVTLACTLVLDGAPGEVAEAVVDYRVHYAGARGVKAPKVFKWARRTLAAGTPVTVSRRHAFEHVSIRRIHPGPHAVDVQVNGRVLGSRTVDVIAAVSST